MTETARGPVPAVRRRSLFTAILDLFSSVWFGIALMVLIFLYMFIASAGLLRPVDWSNPGGPWMRWVVRETFGMTEMEAFDWWPFTALIALFVINMVVVTVRRIRFNVLNFGVWMIHTGIVILALGSVYYFSTKLEGDTLVFRRNIQINVPGAPPARLVAQLGAATEVKGSNGTYQLAVQSIQPNWPLLSGDDKGKTACSVNVSVTSPEGSFIRQMLIGYPQYTEDILPGKGRAIKSLGRKLVDENLALTFGYEPQNYFYLMDSAALYVREVGAKDWIERPIDNLPHFSNNIASRDEIWQPAGDPPITPNPLDLKVPAVSADDPLAGTDVRVTERLHYVESIESRWIPGGEQFNPMLGLVLKGGDSGDEHIQMLAMVPDSSTAKDGMLAFRWAQTPQDVDRLAQEVGNVLRVSIPDENVDVALPIEEKEAEARADDPFKPIPGSTWTYRVGGYSRNLKIGDKSGIAVVSVEFQKGDETIKRFVFEDASQSHDRTADGGVTAPDPRIQASYRPGPALLFIGGPSTGDLVAVVNDADTRVPLEMGKAWDVGPGLSIVPQDMYPNAQLDRRMAVTPKRLQDNNVGAQLSQIKVVISKGAWSLPMWLPYHHYPFPDRQYAGNRFRYAPRRITLPDGKQIEILFSRKRWPLPAAVTLEDFELLTHVGGFVPGNTTSVRNFISILRSYHDGKWSKPYTASLNEPASDSGMYYFQSTWDPGTMAYTGLGVGNRNGVHVQLFGCAVAVLGMIYVFYVKPIIKRRRRAAVWASVAAERTEQQREPVSVG
ncbi:MAG TPA: hypothetical protein P5572_12655 [Phycisphaerae bacterium]|nr:hypothetical protein [Phycisphaerae bacterium]